MLAVGLKELAETPRCRQLGSHHRDAGGLGIGVILTHRDDDASEAPAPQDDKHCNRQHQGANAEEVHSAFVIEVHDKELGAVQAAAGKPASKEVLVEEQVAHRDGKGEGGNAQEEAGDAKRG